MCLQSGSYMVSVARHLITDCEQKVINWYFPWHSYTTTYAHPLFFNIFLWAHGHKIKQLFSISRGTDQPSDFQNHLGTKTCKLIPTGISKPCRILNVIDSCGELMLKFLKIVVESYLPQVPKCLWKSGLSFFKLNCIIG